MKKFGVFLASFLMASAVIAQTSISDISATWDNAATTYDAMKMTVTDTDSAAGSNLLKFTASTGGSFIVDKNGNLVVSGTVSDSGGVIVGGWNVNDTVGGNYGQGVNVLASLTSGTGNIVAGDTGAITLSTGANNILFGEETRVMSGAVSNSIIMGYQARGGSSDVNLGHRTGFNLNSSAYNNVIIGASAGSALTSGHNHIVIGQAANALVGSEHHQIAIGTLHSYFVQGSMSQKSDANIRDLQIFGPSAFSGATSFTSAGNLNLKMGDHATAGGSAGLVRILAPDDQVVASFSEDIIKMDNVVHNVELAATPAAVSGYSSTYTKTDDILYYQDGGGTEHRLPHLTTKSYTFVAPSTSNGTYYTAGFYDASATDANLTNASLTVTFGDANNPYAAHAYVVAGGAGTTDGSDLVVTGSCTSITDAGVRTAADSEVIVADATVSSTNDYYEMSKKCLGTVTFTLSSTGGTTFAYDFNYGYVKYEDFGNQSFTLRGFESVGLADSNDSGFNIQLFHHNDTGWTYAATGFVAGNTPLFDLQTMYVNEYEASGGEGIAFKRTPLNTTVDGSASEGLIIAFTTTSNGSIAYINSHLGVELN